MLAEKLVGAVGFGGWKRSRIGAVDDGEANDFGIEQPGQLPQVGESPDRGLDASTPSGREVERADLRPPRQRLTRR